MVSVLHISTTTVLHAFLLISIRVTCRVSLTALHLHIPTTSDQQHTTLRPFSHSLPPITLLLPLSRVNHTPATFYARTLLLCVRHCINKLTYPVRVPVCCVVYNITTTICKFQQPPWGHTPHITDFRRCQQFPKCAPRIPGSQRIRSDFPGYPWIHFCNVYF